MLLTLFAAGIHGEHQHLVAETIGHTADKRRVVDGRRVDTDLVCTAAQQRVDVLGRAYAAAHSHWDEHLFGGAGDHVNHRVAVGAGCGHIQEGDLVGALTIVFGRQLHRVARILEVFEMHTLHHATGVNVQARDDSYRQRHASLPCSALHYSPSDYLPPVTCAAPVSGI